MILVEACVTSARSARAAQASGVGRIELCARIAHDGLTPAARTVADTRAVTDLPIRIMLRPHDRGYVYDARARRALSAGVALAHAHGVEGVVVGCLTSAHTVDAGLLGDLIARARPLRVTFHRAFDLVRDPAAALETLIALGVDDVLTSGGASTAARGAEVLRRLVRQADGRIRIVAAGRIRATNAPALVAATGVGAVHAHTDAPDFRALVRILADVEASSGRALMEERPETALAER
jgi:copper homeostasis protein